jgi:hypothetical protein
MSGRAATDDENIDIENVGVIRIGIGQVLSTRFVHETGCCEYGRSGYLVFNKMTTIHGEINLQ